MNRNRMLPSRSARLMVLVGAGFLFSTAAHAGNVFLTGHDTLLHSGQRGYSAVVMEYLRNGEGTVATYDVLYLTSGGTPGGLAALTTAGYSITTMTKAAFNADPATALVGIDAIAVPWQPDGGAVAPNPAIISFFNAGGDIYANSSVGVDGFYDFLPPSASAEGPSLSASSGFAPTAAGAAIGITLDMVNGDPTHNTFSTVAPAFTVMETFVSTGQIISVGLRDGMVTDDGIIITDDGTPPAPGVPDTASSALLLVLGLAGLASFRRPRMKK